MTPLDKAQPERQNIAVEYAHTVLHEIRAHVTGNFARDLESGGVLFGTHSSRIVTVSEMRPASCSYASGPVFVLSPGDHRKFEEVAALHQTDPALEGMEPVGWFLSHVRDSLVLRPADREIFDRYFNQQWQMALVMRPGQVGSLRAATIGRNLELTGEIVLNEFTIKQVAAVETAPAPESGPAMVDSPVVSVKLMPRAPVEPERTGSNGRVQSPNSPDQSIVLRGTAATVPFRTASPPPPRRSQRWIGIGVVTCLALLIALAASMFLNANAPDAVALQAFERDGVLNIEWDPKARSVAQAAEARLEIADGSSKTERILTREELRRGFFSMIRKQADVTARLKLRDGAGKLKEEQTRYIGRPIMRVEVPKPAAPAVVVAPRQDDSALREELARARQRSNELERRIKVLQTIIQRRDGK